VNRATVMSRVLLGAAIWTARFNQAQGSPLPNRDDSCRNRDRQFCERAVPDIAVTNKGSNTLGVYLGLGKGTFASRIELNTPVGPAALIASTLTTSGTPDIRFGVPGSGLHSGRGNGNSGSLDFANSAAAGVGADALSRLGIYRSRQ